MEKTKIVKGLFLLLLILCALAVLLVKIPETARREAECMDLKIRYLEAVRDLNKFAAIIDLQERMTNAYEERICWVLNGGTVHESGDFKYDGNIGLLQWQVQCASKDTNKPNITLYFYSKLSENIVRELVKDANT